MAIYGYARASTLEQNVTIQEDALRRKAKGIYTGRKPSIDPAEVRRLRTEEKLGATAIAERLGIGRASVYRVLASNDQS
jgi:DNA invertase Pin-like site-specific DNA recombinase